MFETPVPTGKIASGLAMRTVNNITISADPEAVFVTASNILDWPKILPHYRWVRQTREGVYEMAARRSCVPVKWVSTMRLDRAARRVYFTHIGGLTRGMEVVWEIDSTEGGTSVRIVHDLSTLNVPIVRSAPGKFVTGRIFVYHVAQQTLQYMKRYIEEVQMAGLRADHSTI